MLFGIMLIKPDPPKWAKVCYNTDFLSRYKRT